MSLSPEAEAYIAERVAEREAHPSTSHSVLVGAEVSTRCDYGSCLCRSVGVIVTVWATVVEMRPMCEDHITRWGEGVTATGRRYIIRP